MKLAPLDWIVIAAYFAISLLIGLYYSRRANGSTEEFFLSGRSVPWWLAGTSMVATTFAADTPLAVTGLTARNGIAGNWLWWSFVMSGMLTVFLYARLWRRSEVMTDVEFAEIRYAGKPAAFLRGFRALYLGIPINCIVIGWVNLAMLKIMENTLGVSHEAGIWLLVGMLLMTAFYTSLSGFWGVLVTDLFQFGLAMVMVILLAYYSVAAVGGMAAMKAKILALDVAAAAGTAGGVSATGSRMAFFPELGSAWMPLITLMVYLSVNWWASWYPGSEPGGGGYVAQRIFSAKDERNGMLATLWFNLAHYCLRTWPWVLTALATVILYPELQDKESGYIRILMDPAVFPPSLRGLMLAAFAAAYMSTISTQLNWGASYVMNDFYRRFVRKDASDRHYVRTAQAFTAVLMAISVWVTLNLGSISSAWKILMATGAGTGGVLLLRWYWWRINAWSEIAAMVTAAVVSIALQLGWGLDTDRPVEFAWILLITTGLTMAATLAVTYLTPAEPKSKLEAFYRRIQPAGPGWKPFTRGKAASLMPALIDWVMGCVLIYGALLGTGKLLFGEWGPGGLGIGAAALGSVYFARRFSAGARSPQLKGSIFSSPESVAP